MSQVKQLESQVSALSREDLAKFRAWFDRFWAEVADRELERRVESGEFDELAAQALRDAEAGRCTDL